MENRDTASSRSHKRFVHTFSEHRGFKAKDLFSLMQQILSPIKSDTVKQLARQTATLTLVSHDSARIYCVTFFSALTPGQGHYRPVLPARLSLSADTDSTSSSCTKCRLMYWLSRRTKHLKDRSLWKGKKLQLQRNRSTILHCT